MRNVQFYEGGIYHVYNRGVDKRTIFQNDSDRKRFMKNVELFNNTNYRSNQSPFNVNINTSLPKQPYVRIMCYSLMPNHFHFQLEQLVEAGISTFMGRLANGYTKYFNTKHKRKGRLFESSFKAIEVTKNDYLLHLTRYIHLNSLGLIEPGWKENGILSWKSVSKFLKSYQWSSYQSYLEIKKDPILDLGILKDMIQGPKSYAKFMREWTEKSFDKIHPLNCF
jgi:putative transposase